MIQLILNFQNDSEATGGMMTSSSRVASHNYASHTHQQESDSEKKMSAICGLKCVEQLEKFNHVGSWAKTFSALLIGMEGWYSKRCKLIWKLKGTKSNRMYFQLRPLALHTEGIESGLLPTPTSVQRDHPNRVEALKATGAKTMMSRANGENRPNSILDAMNFYGMLPTPTAMDSTNATATMKSSQVKEGSMHSVTLTRAMAMGMLPTPATRDANNAEYPDKYQKRKEYQAMKGVNLEYPLRQFAMDINPTGKTSQLSPQFTLEMMGFQTDWTLLPFLNGETNQ
jgi:hypothetical protein